MTHEHEGSEEELLFKYVSADPALTCLPEVGDGALRASQPAALNDPFECTMTKGFVESDRKAGNRALALTLTEIQPRDPETEDNVEKLDHSDGEIERSGVPSRMGVAIFSGENGSDTPSPGNILPQWRTNRCRDTR